MSATGLKRVVVLAEPESLFLPNSIAQLARLHPLTAIVEVPPPPLRVSVKRGWNAFGPVVMSLVVAAEAVARIVDRLSRNRYYSLRKVADRLGIPYERVSGLHAPDCVAAITRHRPDVVFAQVSRRVRPELLALAPFWNKHCSLLPGHAGVFPVFWTLLDEQAELGVTIHVMDEEFDRGPILQQARIPRDGQSFFGAYRALYDQVAPLLDRALRDDAQTTWEPSPAIEPSYHSFPTPADRAEFRRKGRRFGFPFRLQPPVEIAGPSAVHNL
jgi:hypothetical protein